MKDYVNDQSPGHIRSIAFKAVSKVAVCSCAGVLVCFTASASEGSNAAVAPGAKSSSQNSNSKPIAKTTLRTKNQAVCETILKSVCSGANQKAAKKMLYVRFDIAGGRIKNIVILKSAGDRNFELAVMKSLAGLSNLGEYDGAAPIIGELSTDGITSDIKLRSGKRILNHVMHIVDE